MRADEDKLEGDVGPGRPDPPRGRIRFPDVSVTGTSKRLRAAWFNRTTGAGKIKLATPRDLLRQRVIVKIKPVVHAQVGRSGGAGSLMRHALYVEREGAGRDGDKVQVFDRELDGADGAAFVERCAHDRHHFRIILSPENGGELKDLKTYTRELMRRVEDDLGTRVDWIAAEHHDTGRPHVHLLLRGRREDGRDLVIPRAYVSHRFRGRAEEIATRELGLRVTLGLDQAGDQSGERAVRLECFTHLDQALLQCRRDHDIAFAHLPADGRARNQLVRRLHQLSEFGLAVRIAPDRWRLDHELEDKLVRRGDARERANATARLLALEDRGLEPERMRTLEGARTQRVVGRLVGFEAMGTAHRVGYLVGLEGVDGRFWTARVGRFEDLRVLNGLERGAIIELSRAPIQLRPADRTILAIAGEERRYSPERHRAAVPSDRDAYIVMHVRRLEALRRAGIVERDPEGVFRLPADFEAQVLKQAGRGGRESAHLRLLDANSLLAQARYHGPTWLDRTMARHIDMEPLGADSFGAEVRAAQKLREATLKQLRLAYEAPHGLILAPDLLTHLGELERAGVRRRIEIETGLVPHFARNGERVEGIFVSRIHMSEKAFALIAQEHTATLVPWRPDMDRALNQPVSGTVRGQDFDFKYGKGVEKNIGKALGKGLGIDL